MIPIKIKKDEGYVKVYFEIDGTPAWAYEYHEDQDYNNDSNSGRPANHTLGEPFELIKSHHSWKIMLVNPSDHKIKVDVKLIWKQVVQGTNKEIQTWIKKSIEIEVNGGEKLSDSGMIIKV